MRIKWIDIAKGIAMICVILGHMGGIIVGGVNLNFVFAFHLPVFFLLSGYTLKKKELTKEYVNIKFKSLMIPYFWSCFVVLAMDVFNQCFLNKNAEINHITNVIATDLTRFFFASGTHKAFAGIDIGSRIGAIWFLPAIFFATIIVQYVLNKTEKAYMRWLITGSIALIAYVSSSFIWFPFSIQSGAFAALLILAGYYIKEYDIISKLTWKQYSIFALILLYAIFTEKTKIYYVTNSYQDVLISLVISVTSSLFIFKLSMLLEKCTFLSYVGENSIYFLCTHLVALETMYGYFVKVLSIVGVPKEYEKWGFFVCNLVFCTVVTWCILFVKKKCAKKNKNEYVYNGHRDYAIDLEKGILILAMLIGYYSIDTDLRNIIYSFHMMAFVLMSGYFYKKKGSLKSILIPFILYYIFVLILNKDIPSIGTAYFILLLLTVRIIYTIVDTFVKEEFHKVVVIVGISYLGMLLGSREIWLPWNMDCAMYAVVFYMIGYYCRKYHVLEFFKKNLIMYFVLAPIWVFMIYKGGMEIETRCYNQYGLVILGVVSATILLYLFCTYIHEALPKWISRVTVCIGENMFYILIVHIILGDKIGAWVANIFDQRYLYHMIVNISIQILIGIIIGIAGRQSLRKINQGSR